MDKFAEHTRAFVKVEDGCNRRCACCVIPRRAGAQPRRGERAGGAAPPGPTPRYKEVVLTAISLPSYGTDSGTRPGWADRKKPPRCPALSASGWAALTPDMLHDDDIRRMAAVKKLCPQFHLSLQSGCDKTLRAMRRPYDGPVRRYCSQAARGIRCGQRQLYHRCHRRLPRRDGG